MKQAVRRRVHRSVFALQWRGAADVRLVLVGALDRESRDRYSDVTLVALDGGSEPLNGSVALNISVDDANDNAPVFERAVYEAHVYENDTAGTCLCSHRIVLWLLWCRVAGSSSSGQPLLCNICINSCV